MTFALKRSVAPQGQSPPKVNFILCVALQRHSIGTTSVQYAHWFLKEMSEEVNQVITAISEEQTMLADKVSDLTPHRFWSFFTDLIYVAIVALAKELCCCIGSKCQP